MEKLNNIPHKFLFYVGFFIVLIFLSLSYWQFTSFQDDKITLNEFKNNNISSSISISDLYSNNNENVFEFNKVVIKNSKNFTKISKNPKPAHLVFGESNTFSKYKPHNCS